jgi:uncharacterized radical SAM protein YgiQ
MFLPTTKEEMKKLGWERPDIILVSGDSYIDSPFIGIALIGKLLLSNGYKVAIIAQPDINSKSDICRLGEPSLFWGVSAGCIDSMVANKTASMKKRQKDDFTPGGINNRRPDRAVMAYSNLIRRFFKNTSPIVLGGIEASLRRLAHYDCWSNKIRRSILLDAKADYLLYGMAERSVLELAESLKAKEKPLNVKGLCYITNECPDDAFALPHFEEIQNDKKRFIDFSLIFFDNCEPKTAKKLSQKYGNRYIIHNPPAEYLNTAELDKVFELNFEREQHPFYEKDGSVRALETIRFSITTHRGCFGQCNFCAIAIHQGRIIRSRSEGAILKEVEQLKKHKKFRGIINDVGGPTANMYATSCSKMDQGIPCQKKRCLHPETCSNLKLSHNKHLSLLQKIRKISGVKKVFVASGIRYDMLMADKQFGKQYLTKLLQNSHISGQMKIAPEHSVKKVLDLMGKPGVSSLLEFKKLFDSITKEYNIKNFLTYYIIAAHPGCTQNDMFALKDFLKQKLKHIPEQVQIFTPTPSTFSTLMYYTQSNPILNQRVFVEKNLKQCELQKKVIIKPQKFKKKTH